MSVDVFALLADPMRRRMVEILHDGERSVNEIVAKVRLRQSGVSRHLRILYEAGFVQVRSDGQRRIYSLRPDRFRDLEAWMRSYAYDQLGRLERLSKLVDTPIKNQERKP
ncbi:MAG TPA: metalloregulator ArsR/SmtB family transcription factor [Thermoplasmata archaeon]|nr:metalloregulator ArsR/SmtB family transcription factor [Thermoplasmata archaeon]